MSGRGRRTTGSGLTPQAGARRADDLPEWVELSYVIAGIVVFAGGILTSLVWLWFSTDGYFGSLAARLTVVALLLVPAVIASGVAAVVAGFVAPLVVGIVKAAIAFVSWARGKRADQRVALTTRDSATAVGNERESLQ
ncbi:hypothetical protein ACGFZC_35265 [[Kitasatospora] papulosa]|uniref:hypothetical protein n=1 Tax=[Kitasatospora] papulosa TaxID=1464011 RepID=UPI003722E666